MRLFRVDNGFVIEYDNTFYHSQENISWDDLINRDDLYHHLKDLVAQGNLPESKSLDDHKILAPLVNQKCGLQELLIISTVWPEWRSQKIREEETLQSSLCGGAS